MSWCFALKVLVSVALLVVVVVVVVEVVAAVVAVAVVLLSLVLVTSRGHDWVAVVVVLRRLVFWCFFTGKREGGLGVEGGMLTLPNETRAASGAVLTETSFVCSSVLCECSASPWTPGLRCKKTSPQTLLALRGEWADFTQAGWFSDLSFPARLGVFLVN